MLEKYHNKLKNRSNGVLDMIEKDIKIDCIPYDSEVRYAGRGNSNTFHIAEVLVPEFSYNEVFYIHDCMYELCDKEILGYTKEFADNLMHEILLYEGFLFADLYYIAVKNFG